jgi:hypothetical protein
VPLRFAASTAGARSRLPLCPPAAVPTRTIGLSSLNSGPLHYVDAIPLG